MVRTPLVSILIPAYNAEEWLGDTIKSALGQTWQNKEIIIIDDGSKDSTFSVAKRFESHSVKVISQENRGASAARNKALSLSQGDFIQWLDSDDLLAPDKIEQQVKRIDNRTDSWKTLYSSAFGFFYYRHRSAKFIPTSLWQNLPPLDWMLIKFRKNLWMSLDAWLVSRGLTESAGPWNENLSLDDDGDYFCRVVLASDKVVFVPEAKSYCRRGSVSSLSLRRSRSAIESLFLSHSSCIQRLRIIEDSDRTKMASLMLLQRWLIYYYPEYPDIIQKVMTIARELGGELHYPTLRWKYAWMRNAIGWEAAKSAQHMMPMMRVLARKHWDKILYRLSI